MKIQINNLEALERLIGGDATMEFEIRQSVVEAFTKKHLKALANSELMKTTSGTIQEELRNEFMKWEKPKPGSYGYGQWEIKGDVRDKINKAVQAEVDNTLREVIREEIKRADYEIKMKDLVQQQIEYITDKWTDGTIERMINLGVDKKIKEKLNLQ